MFGNTHQFNCKYSLKTKKTSIIEMKLVLNGSVKRKTFFSQESQNLLSDFFHEVHDISINNKNLQAHYYAKSHQCPSFMITLTTKRDASNNLLTYQKDLLGVIYSKQLLTLTSSWVNECYFRWRAWWPLTTDNNGILGSWNDRVWFRIIETFV